MPQVEGGGVVVAVRTSFPFVVAEKKPPLKVIVTLQAQVRFRIQQHQTPPARCKWLQYKFRY